jgi:hypothetical protein
VLSAGLGYHRVPSLNFLKEKLFGLQLPGGWVIKRHVDVVSRKRNIGVARCGGPRIESKGNFAWGLVHTLANLFLCMVCTPKYLRTKGVVVRNVLFGNGRPAEFEEAAKPTALD